MQRFRPDQLAHIYFPAIVNGALVTGLDSSVFTTKVLSPTGGSVGNYTVTENNAKPGIYTFTVPLTDIQSHGAGTYTYTVEMGTPVNAVYLDVFEVVDEAGEARCNLAFDAAANTMRINIWLHRDRGTEPILFNGEPPLPTAAAPLAASFRLYAQDGTVLTDLYFTTTIDTQGVASFNIAAPAFPLGETATYAVVTMTTGNTPQRTFRDVVGFTFSRAQ